LAYNAALGSVIGLRLCVEVVAREKSVLSTRLKTLVRLILW